MSTYMKQTAPELLSKASAIMAERGKQYDKPDGERSMGRAVGAFNCITGRDLTEAEGWLLLQMPDGKWRNRMTDLQRWGDRHLFFDQDTDGTVEKYWKTINYDPRKRAWYEAAMMDRKSVQWTEPYTFFNCETSLS